MTKKRKSLRSVFRDEHQAWRNMIHRCYNKDHRAYPEYGGRGITVCQEWRYQDTGLLTFLRDMAGRDDGETLDRIDNNKGYSPENCRWADRKTQQNNRRPYQLNQLDFGLGFDRTSPRIEYLGRVQSLHAWANELGLEPPTIRQRLKAGDTIEQAFRPVSRAACDGHGKRNTETFLIKRT